MSKKRFVQGVVIRSLPKIEKLPDAIRYAENLYDGLTKHGYGADKAEPRQSKDFYRALDSRQSYWFDKFWGVYNHKQDRNGAAMRWGQLTDSRGDKPIAPTDEFYEFVIGAARKEAQKQLPQGQVRKMAQGWLHEQRYNDYQPTAINKNAVKNRAIQELTARLLGIKKLYEASQDEALLPQIEKLENAIKEARNV